MLPPVQPCLSTLSLFAHTTPCPPPPQRQSYGSSYKVMLRFFPGRSQSQLRERWMCTLNPDNKLGPWTPEEDRALFFGVQQYVSCRVVD